MKLIRFFLVMLLVWMGALGLGAKQASAAQPVFASNAVSVNRTSSYLLDTITYTIRLDNTAGTADALDVVFTDHLPDGMDIQLFSVNGVPQVLSLLGDSVYIGTVAAGTTRIVTIGGVVNSIPRRPAAAQYQNQASWTYRYRPTAGAAKVNASYTSNTVTTPVMRLEVNTGIVTLVLAPILNLGTQYTYTTTITNTGTVNSQGTTLTNALPLLTAYRAGTTKLNGVTLADSGGAGPFVLGGMVNSPGRPAGQINAGETATVSFAVTSLLLPGVNIAIVDADGSGPTPALNWVGSAAPLPVADLAVTLSNGTTSVSAGSDTTYTITVKNNGPSAVTALNLSNSLPLTFGSRVWTASSGAYNASTGDWTGLSLASGASVTLTLKTRISALASGTVSYSVLVSPTSDYTDSNSTNNSATDTDTVAFSADLSVTQSDSLSSIAQGTVITYAITVSNAGPATVSNLTLTDTYSSVLQNVGFSPDEGTYNSSTGSWTGINLAVGESVQMTMTGTVALSATGSLTNTVTVASPVGIPDLNLTNNSATDINSITVFASLILIQTVDKVAAKPGEILTYTINYRNGSALPLPSVGILNDIPELTTFVGATYGTLPSSLTGCTLTSPTVGEVGTVKWTFAGNLAPGQSGVVSFQVLVK